MLLKIFATLFVVIGAGLFFYIKATPLKLLNDNKYVQSVEKQIPTDNQDTSSWKSYTNKKYSYSIKYPEEAEVYLFDVKTFKKVDSSVLENSDEVALRNIPTGMSLTISTKLTKDPTQSLEDFVNKKVKDLNENMSDFPDYKALKAINQFLIDGKKAIYVSSEGEAESLYEWIFIEQSPKQILYLMHGPDKQGNAQKYTEFFLSEAKTIRFVSAF